MTRKGGFDRSSSWLWYSWKTARCVPLYANAYGTSDLGSTAIPWPNWACRAPNGGVHIDHRLGRIDIEVTEPPDERDELAWTCNFTVCVVKHTWLDEIRDLIDETRVFLGDVRSGGEAVPGWSTIHEPLAPPLVASGAEALICPICGDHYNSLLGRLSVEDPNAEGRPLFVNMAGIFVREDLALARNLRKPSGAFVPSRIHLRASSYPP